MSSSENVTNTTSDNVIEEFNLDPLSNPYFVPKSQEEKRQQIAFKNRLNYMAKKKANSQPPQKRKKINRIRKSRT